VIQYASSAPSNRAPYRVPQKTNLQIDAHAVSIDRVSLKCYTSSKIDPESALAQVFGLHRQDKRTTRRGQTNISQWRAYDSPQGTPGGCFYSLEQVPSSSSSALLARIEWNPNPVPWKLSRVLQWLSEALLVNPADIWLDRLDIAFDFYVPRAHFTIQPPPRRKVFNVHEAGQVIETTTLKASASNPGWTLYDKQKERAHHREHIEHPWTRCELKFRPSSMEAPSLTELRTFELPTKLGGKLLYMPDVREDFNLTSHDCHFYALCREFAEFDPIRAKRRIAEYAGNRRHGTELAESLMLSVDLDAIWRDHRPRATAGFLDPPCDSSPRT